jgi:hypothetical protein
MGCKTRTFFLIGEGTFPFAAMSVSALRLTQPPKNNEYRGLFPRGKVT